MSDNLHENPERDGFRSESPIRAFTTWITQGNYALGKGFRPSLQHMIPYMHAMESVENWKLLQVLESATLTPSFLFHREPEMSFAELDRWLKNKGFVLAADPDGCVRLYEPLDYQRQKIEPITRAHTAMSRVAEALDRDDSQRDYGDENPEPRPDAIPSGIYWSAENDNFYSSAAHSGQGIDFYDEWYERRDEFPGDPRLQQAISIADDPVNPKHYGGTACAEIGERMTANSYQVLKYNWRLGEKDDPVIELGKAIWYLDREINWPQSVHGIPGSWLPSREWFGERLEGKDRHVRGVVDLLYRWNSEGKIAALLDLRKSLLAKKAEHEVCTTGLAV